jgi:Cu(I)/Ag(I) efflux system outer membrane protein
MSSAIPPRGVAALFAILLAASLPACSLAPDYVRPQAPIPEAVTAADGEAPAARLRLAGRREFFKDARLRELIDLSLEHNRDLRLAALAVAEARAAYGVTRAERFPQLAVDGTAAYSGSPDAGGVARSYEAPLVAAFELDVFGRLHSMSESAFQNFLAAEEARKAVVISLVSQVAQSYFAERLAVERLRLARDNAASWRNSLAFIRQRLQSGQSSLLNLEQARSMVEFAAAGVAQREREVIQAGNALRLLTGSFTQREFSPPLPLRKQLLADLPQGAPSSVLLGRPDIMAAEYALRAANADIGAARAAFFPSISLTGNLGYMSEELSRLFTPGASFWSFLPSVRLPIFSGGRNAAELELAEIRKESSIVQYEKAVQTAFREAADALQSRESFARQLQAQESYLASQRQVLALATQQYAGGAVSYLEVLDAQRNVFQAEQDLLQIRYEQLINDVSLYGALGGGLGAAGGAPPAAGP